MDTDKHQAILECRKKILELSAQQDALYEELEASLGLHPKHYLSSWLWDYIFNGAEYSLEHVIDHI